MPDINAAWFPEISRISDLANGLKLLETDPILASLARETITWMATLEMQTGEPTTEAMRAICVLQIGYIAGIEAYEREHPVEAKEEG